MLSFSINPKLGFENLLNELMSNFEPVTYDVSAYDLMVDEADKFKEYLVESLKDDIEFFKTKLRLYLSSEYVKPYLELSFVEDSGSITKLSFAYIPSRRHIIFAYRNNNYLYEIGFFALLMASYVPAEVKFKMELRRMLLGKNHKK